MPAKKMNFISLIEKLEEEFGDDKLVRKNGTILYGPGTIPKCRHMVFRGLEEEYIKEFVLDEYKLKFPPEYLELLRHLNGANLLNIKISFEAKKRFKAKKEKIEFAHSLLCLYGIPHTPPMGRPIDMEEPFDMRVEDYARHPEIPEQWLKCGRYANGGDAGNDTDIFIDTETEKVYSVNKNEKEIVSEWDSLDECLCSLWDLLSKAQTEQSM